ncbi:MAG TPA: glycosyltransferase family 4 protein [Devosia sp.]|nr:glycosyltransferase family 4 protein [Devosia sp.]
MRIAIMTELYPPSVGGQEFFFAGLGRELTRRGHEVEIYCIGHELGLPPRESEDGMLVVRNPIAPTYKKPTMKWTKRSLRAMFRYAVFTRSIARERRHDVYLLNEWPLLHMPFLPAAARQRTILHWCEIRKGRLFSFLQARLPRLAAKNAAISASVAAEIERASGRAAVVFPSGLDLEAYQVLPKSERSGILSIGRLAPHKNLFFLIRSFEQLRARGYTGRLIIAGSGPIEAEIRAAARASTSAAFIDVLGEVSDAKKIELLASSELLAMPSEREGFPRVVAEAMASGLPTVTMDYPENGTKDVVRDRGGGIVTASDVNAFTTGMQDAMANWQSLSSTGIAAAIPLSWSVIAAEFERVAGDLVR